MITSADNPQIRQIIRLNTKARARREAGCFAAEGVRIFRETPEALRRQVYVSETFAAEHPDMLADIPAEVVDDRLFSKICDTQTPQGILTLCDMPGYTEDQLLGSGDRQPLIIILEDLQDPGNVGTILRTAEGAGVTGVILGGHTADIFQPKVIRSTMGSVFRVPFRREKDLEQTLEWLHARGICSYAAHLSGSVPYTDGDYRGGTAFLIGNEGNGLSESLTAMARQRVRIPMEGQVESLNAAVSASILMYEARRQRFSNVIHRVTG